MTKIGRLNKALDFNFRTELSLNSYVTAYDLTISFWVYYDGVGTTVPLTRDGIQALRFYASHSYLHFDPVSKYFLLAGSMPDADKWVHYVLTRDGDRFRVYHDGEYYTISTGDLVNHNIIITTFGGTVGRASNSEISEIKIWERSLSEAEVKQLYRSKL